MAAQPSSADGPAVLRFHERCGAAVMVTDDGMTVEKKEKIEQADNEGGQQPWKYWKVGGSSCAAITNRPLRTSEVFEVEITKAFKHPLGTLSVGLISQSPEMIEFPLAMTDLRAGTWMLHGLSSGANIVVSGETTKKDFLRPDVMNNLKCGDKLGVMITKERSLVVILNRKIVGTAATGIPEDAHAFVEIHGKYEAVKLNLLSPEELAQINAVNEDKVVVREEGKYVGQKLAANELPAVDYKRQFESAQEELIRAQAEIRRLDMENQRLQRVLHAQQQQREVAMGIQQQYAVQQIEQEKKQLQAQIHQNETRLRAAENGNKGLQQQIRSLQQQLQFAEQLSREQGATIQQSAQHQIRSLEQRLATSMDQLRQEQASNASLRHEVQSLQHKLQTYQQQPSTSAIPQQYSPQHTEFWEVSRKEVTTNMQNVLGTGAWGYAVEGRFRGQTVAVKFLHAAIQEPEFIKTIRKEISIMAQIRHPNLVLLIAAVVDKEAGHLIVTEMLDTSLLNAYQKGKLSTVTCKLSIFRDIASALNYLHLHRPGPIIHRDVSSANVLLEAKPNDMWKAKLSDFGSAKLVSEAATLGPGSPAYSAPEVRSQLGIPQTPKVDVYSYGILLCEVAVGQFPSHKVFPEMVRSVAGSWPPMHHLIDSCIQPNPENRLEVVAILADLDRLIQYTRIY